MRNSLALAAVGALVLTGCSEPREQSAVEVTPPAVVEVPIQTIFHQAITAAMSDEAIISTGLPAIDSLNGASAELDQYAPEPAACAGTIDPDLYTTNEVAIGFYSDSEEDVHTAQTVVAAGFDTAEDATAYFAARTDPWNDCATVDLTIDETNVLTLHYAAASLSDTPELDVPEVLTESDQDMVLTSTGELSGAFETSDTPVPDAGALPDYVISPDEVPEPDAENISISNATVVVRFDTQVFWSTVEPGSDVDAAVETLAEVAEAVRAEQ